MNQKKKSISLVVATLVAVLATSAVVSAQDRDTIKVPGGLSFSEFKGYESGVPRTLIRGV